MLEGGRLKEGGRVDPAPVKLWIKHLLPSRESRVSQSVLNNFNRVHRITSNFATATCKQTASKLSQASLMKYLIILPGEVQTPEMLRLNPLKAQAGTPPTPLVPKVPGLGQGGVQSVECTKVLQAMVPGSSRPSSWVIVRPSGGREGGSELTQRNICKLQPELL